jgi:hypothetical protein
MPSRNDLKMIADMLGDGADPKVITNLQFILEDLLAGDPNAEQAIRGIDVTLVKTALDFLLNHPDLSEHQKSDLLANGWRINFRAKPPSPEEFLTYKYLGPTANNIYPHIKEAFLEYMNPTKPYRTAVLYPHIGWGKSMLTVLINLYIGIHLSFMKAPWKFFGQSPATVYTQVFCATSMKKGSELLFEPMLNILESSEFFEKVHTREGMVKADAEFSRVKGAEQVEKLFWTTAVPTSALQFSNGANFKLISNPNGLLGQTIVSGSMTELGFFYEAGRSDDYIFKFFNKLRTRIESRMKGNYYGRFILDSSPNTLESVIDDWIMHDAPKSHQNFIVKGSRWKFFPEDFEGLLDKENGNQVIQEKGKGFPVYLGGKGKPPAVLSFEYDRESYPPQDVLWVPDHHLIRGPFEENVFESLKDIAGIPAGSSDKIFYDMSKVEGCFQPKLKNLYYCISAKADESPEKLIWNQIKDEFFIQMLNDSYRFWRLPHVPRVLSVDLAVSGDVASVAVSHVERGPGGVTDPVYVVDFTIIITPHRGRINLDAIRYFIVDLIKHGGMKIERVSFDQFQSEAAIQYLKRRGILVERLSVDAKMEPYLNMVSIVEAHRLQVGRNIFVKNNLKSLQIVRRKAMGGKLGSKKVDHTKGDLVYEGDMDWDRSMIGINAKDATDAICANIELLKKYDYVPVHQYEPEKIEYRSEEAAKRNVDDLMESWGMGF